MTPSQLPVCQQDVSKDLLGVVVRSRVKVASVHRPGLICGGEPSVSATVVRVEVEVRRRAWGEGWGVEIWEEVLERDNIWNVSK